MGRTPTIGKSSSGSSDVTGIGTATVIHQHATQAVTAAAPSMIRARA